MRSSGRDVTEVGLAKRACSTDSRAAIVSFLLAYPHLRSLSPSTLAACPPHPLLRHLSAEFSFLAIPFRRPTAHRRDNRKLKKLLPIDTWRCLVSSFPLASLPALLSPLRLVEKKKSRSVIREEEEKEKEKEDERRGGRQRGERSRSRGNDGSRGATFQIESDNDNAAGRLKIEDGRARGGTVADFRGSRLYEETCIERARPDEGKAFPSAAYDASLPP